MALAFDASPAVPERLVFDSGRLRQILLNLVGNAIKFTDSGEILVRIERVPDTEDNSSCELHFSVRDAGCGIAKEKQASIFEAFVQADGSSRRCHGGTGLGLTISSRLVGLMNGKIWMEGELGKGSTFHFTIVLPIASGESGQHDEKSGKGLFNVLPAQCSQPLNVLLAEDNEINWKVAVRLLKNRGHQVTLATNGKQAVNAFMLDHFDLILMDIQMPEMDGLEATMAIRSIEEMGPQRESSQKIPIIAMTAHAMLEDRQRCLDVGMDGFISKPINPAELFERIECRQG